jgi:hypothetical protein
MTNFKDYLFNKIEKSDDESILDEKMYWEYVTRNGKRQKKWHTDKKNFRIQINKKTGQPKEVFITPTERLKRKIGQRKAALKRRSKQKNISARRHKSFNVRKLAGMRYNTGSSREDKNKKHGNSDNYRERDTLMPNMMEALLLEWPHVEILPDTFWDFYSEVGNEDGSWIMQLVTLVREQEMHSMKEGDPKDNNNSTEFEKPKDGVIKVSPGEIEQIFYAISTDMFCVNAIRKAYKLLSYEDRLEFDEAMVAGGQGNFLKKVKSVDYT